MNAQTKNIGLRLIGLVVILVALLAVGIGVTGAAARAAIPGDALYPVKTGIEQARLTLAEDAGARAQLKMGFAAQRLDEIEALIAEGRFLEVDHAVLAFEANINGALIDLETLSGADPARAAVLAREITAALTEYARTLSALTANVPDDVRSEVNRALDSTHLAGSLDVVPGSGNANGNGNEGLNDNGNINDDNGNDTNGNDDNGNASNSNDDNGNSSNDNGIDDNGNDAGNANDDNGNDDNGNDAGNANDDNTNVNGNSNDDNGGASNGNGDDNGNDSGGDDNGNDDNSGSGGGSGGGGGSDDNGNDDSGGNGNGGGDNGNDDTGY